MKLQALMIDKFFETQIYFNCVVSLHHSVNRNFSTVFVASPQLSHLITQLQASYLTQCIISPIERIGVKKNKQLHEWIRNVLSRNISIGLCLCGLSDDRTRKLIRSLDQVLCRYLTNSGFRSFTLCRHCLQTLAQARMFPQNRTKMIK